MFRWSQADAVITACVAVSFLLVWPVGEYLIGDDWIYTKSLQVLHYTGVIRVLDCALVTLVGHLYWTLGFTKVFGFSMTIARVSTVVLALVECLGLIALLRQLKIRESALSVAALALFFGPLHFFQSFMYSTDVPTNAWTVLALLFYVRAFSGRSSPSIWQLFVGSCFAGIAVSVRQSAILVVVAMFVYLLLFERKRLINVRLWLACFGPTAAAVLALYAWYFHVHGPTEAYLGGTQAISLHWDQLTFASAVHAVYVPLAYIGLFALPVLAALPLSAYRPRHRDRVIGAAVTTALLVAGFVTVSLRSSFPYLRNKLTAFGYLHPNELIAGARDVLWPSGVGHLIAGALCLAAIGGVLLLFQAWPRSDSSDDTDHARLVGLRLLTSLLALQVVYATLTAGIIFDRHLVMAAPVTIAIAVILGETRARLRWLPFAAVTSALALYGIVGTHDVHSFSRAGFKAGEELMLEGTHPQLIDAGFAFNGWHMYERSREELAAGKSPLSRVGDSWYLALYTPRILSKYVVALSEPMDETQWQGSVAPWAAPYVFKTKLDRHVVIRERSYATFWPPGTKKVYVLNDALLADPQKFIDSH